MQLSILWPREMADFKEQRIYIKFSFRIEEEASGTLQKAFCEHKLVNGINIAEVAKLWFRILNVRVTDW